MHIMVTMAIFIINTISPEPAQAAAITMVASIVIAHITAHAGPY